jgi:DNA primase
MSVFVIDILESFLGKARKHNEGKGQVSFDCVACAIDKGMPEGDGKGNLEVNYHKGVFRCWSCHYINNMHGYIPKLIKRYGTTKLLREYNILKPDTSLIEKFEYADVKLPDSYKKLTDPTDYTYHRNMAMKYLTKRNIGLDLIKKYDIGYTTSGHFKNRIIIPSYDIHEDLNYFIARSFNYKTKPKYLNPEAEKQEIIFNESRINWDATIYLVEGVFDSIVIPNSIPLLGKFISQKLYNLLYNKATTNIIIVLDSDAYLDTEQLYMNLNFGKLKGRVRVCVPDDGYDPSLIYEKEGKYGIVKLLRTSHRITESRIY